MSRMRNLARRYLPSSLRNIVGTPYRAMQRMPLAQSQMIRAGYRFKYDERAAYDTKSPHPADAPNALRKFFDERKKGPGIFKWDHYFDIYDRHFHRFRGNAVNVLEIGVYSGGSLDMWRDYFGPTSTIYGVDIESSCRVYERDGVKIFIGDQADRNFWRRFRENVPPLDIVIDDGGHLAFQQISTLEELLPFMRPGSVYLCEDIHGAFNQFAAYTCGLGHKLNEFTPDNACTPFQASIGSIHLYPFVSVIEKSKAKTDRLRSIKNGSQWQPF